MILSKKNRNTQPKRRYSAKNNVVLRMISTFMLILNTPFFKYQFLNSTIVWIKLLLTFYRVDQSILPAEAIVVLQLVTPYFCFRKVNLGAQTTKEENYSN